MTRGVIVRDPGVDDDQLGGGWQRQTLERQAARVEEARGVLVGQARGHLVHDPHRGADEVVLRRAGDPRDRDIVDLEAERLPERAEDPYLERCAVCWVSAAYTAGGTSPVCVWLSSAGVTAAKVANGAAQCVSGCGLAGAVCHDLASGLHGGRIPSSAHIVNGGCTQGGWYAAEADVCGLGLNRSYARDAPESRGCVAGAPTGLWALSQVERAYLRDPAHCAVRGARLRALTARR